MPLWRKMKEIDTKRSRSVIKFRRTKTKIGKAYRNPF